MKRESELKAAFGRELKRQLPHYIVQMFSTNGSPDRSITGDGRTSSWEFKHGTPDFKSKGDQELMCARLAVQGHCRYVVWQEMSTGLGSRTMIVHPRQILDRTGWNLVPEAWCVGYNMPWLVDQVKKVHGL